MIDLVFMMNIFFLVTSIASAISELDLPPARHVHAADLEKAIIVSIVSAGDRVPPTVRLEDAAGSQTLPAGSQQEERDPRGHRSRHGRRLARASSSSRRSAASCIATWPASPRWPPVIEG